jgi:hypothetical protein
VLLVENSEGQSLPVDVLSRGTREQLFLSVRLALVATFARRGVNLPMVLDDVLVNFDVGRAQKAAEVLTEFAAGGHQLLFFTCHEHIWHMLKALDADCRRLPARRGQPEPFIAAPAPIAAIVEEPKPILVPLPKPKKKQRPKPAPVVTEPLEDWYEYPFVEQLVAETKPAPAAEPVEVEQTPNWFEYTFESPAPMEADHPEPDHAVAYIVGGETGSAWSPPQQPPRRGRTIIGGTTFSNRNWRDDRDHLEPRRA